MATVTFLLDPSTNVGLDLPYFAGPIVPAKPHYEMRALASPGPGYVTWRSDDVPDFAGTLAPAPIVYGTAVVTSAWGLTDVQWRDALPTFQSVTSSPATVEDPGGGIIFVLVDTSSISWINNGVVNLPVSPSSIGGRVTVKDDGGQADTKNIRVDGNGNTIDGDAYETISVQWATLELIWNGTHWRIF
jgi:hypothetical protein